MRSLRRELNIASEDPGAFTHVSDQWVSGTIAVRPAVLSPDLQQLHYRWRNDDGGEGVGAWYNSAWSYRKKITVDFTKVDANQNDFPVYVNLADLGANFFANVESAGGNDGGDIRVTNSDGTTELPREIVAINVGTQTGELHFEADFLSSTVNTDFYIYYGNAAASEPLRSSIYGKDKVWENGYVWVWHLEESPGNGVAGHDDSTGNPNDGTPQNFGGAGSTTSATGKIGGADDLDGVDDYINVGSDAVLDDLGPLTISAWIMPDTYGASGAPSIATKRDPASSTGRWLFEMDNTLPEIDSLAFAKDHVTTGLDVASANSVVQISPTVWQHVVATWDGSINVSGVRLYVDGGETLYGGTTPAVGLPNSDAAIDLSFGAKTDGGNALHAGMDEIRISSSVRLASWIKTEFNNQNSPGLGGFLANIESQETHSADEDTPLTGLAKLTTKRVRIEISNLGAASSGSVLYRLEVSQANPTTCDAGGNTWTRIDTSTHWNMVASTYFADADPTTNIASGLTDENTTFVAGEMKEDGAGIDDETSGVILSTTQFTEIEYAVQATASATDGATYCFRLTDAGTATDFTYTETRYAKVTLSGVGAAISSTNPASLTESNLNTATVTVTLTGGTYNGSLVTGDFSLNGAPTGTTISGVVRDSATQATLTLAFDLTDFDSDANMSVTVATTALVSGGPATTGTVTVTAVLEVGAAITGTNPASLTESNLNTATVTVTLTDGTYNGSLVTGDFSLNGAPTGTSISGVVRDSATQATLTLAFDLTDFDIDANMSVTVATTALVSGGPVTTGTVTVTAVVEGGVSLQQLHYRWRDDDGGGSGPGWYNPAWTYRKKITIDNAQVDANLTQFPVYVDLSDLGADFFANVESSGGDDGGDIRVTTSNGTTELPREVVSINVGTLTGELHFEADFLSSTVNTDFYIYYGNAAASEPAASATYGSEEVWANGYVGAWHLDESPANGGTHFDSTSSGNNGTWNDVDGNGNSNATGQIDGANDFDGIDDVIQTTSNELKTADNLTLSAWIKADATSYAHHIIWEGEATGNGWGPEEEMHLSLGEYTTVGVNDRLSFFLGNAGDPGINTDVLALATDFTDVTNRNFVVVTASNLGTSPAAELFLNGASVATDTGTTVFTTRSLWNTNLRIGLDDSSRYLDGVIDEVRISNVVRTAGWIGTEHNNQLDPGTGVGGFLATIGPQEAQWFDPAWTYRKKITIDNTKVDADQTDFPVYVDLADLGADFFANVESSGGDDGGDIRVTNSDGTTELPREIVAINVGTQTGELHFEADFLSSTVNTDFYIYYGNAAASEPLASSTYGSEEVWANGYVGVWHLDESPTNGGTHSDSTSNGHSGTWNDVDGFGNSNATGQLDGADDFDGSDDYIQTTSNELQTVNNLTLSAWFKADSTAQSHILWQGDGTVGNGWGNTNGLHEEINLSMGNCCPGGTGSVPDKISFFLGDTEEFTEAGALSISVDFTDTTNRNYAVATAANLSTSPAAELFLNGGSIGTDTGTAAEMSTRTNWDTNFRIGRPGDPSRWFNGVIDEVRTSSVVRPASWIKTEFNNQDSPGVGGFLASIDSQEASSGGGATWAADEDTPLTGLDKLTTKRVRIEVSNKGTASSGSVLYRLEVSQANPTTCDAGGNTWTRVNSSTHWNMALSTHFADADATSDIDPGLTNENTTFVDGELKESTDEVNTGITLSTTEFTEIEYAVQATASAIDAATYCFRLTDAGTATDFTYTETKYAKVTLSGLSAAISSTNPASLTESNLNTATVTVTLTGGTYNGSLVTGDFSLNGAPTGTTISGVVRDSATQATLTLAFDLTDFDSDANMSVTVATTALVSGGPVTTGTVTVTAVLEVGAAITGTNPASLTESNLNTATVTVTLTDGTYNGSLVTGDFSLNGAPTGTSISGVVRDSATQATLTLAFDLTDFDIDANMSVTVATTALVSGGPATTGTVTVTAVVEGSPDLQQLHYRWRDDDGGGSGPGWYNPAWTYRKKITIDNAQVDANLTDFPVYVDLSDLGADFFANVESSGGDDGGDIRVTTSNGTTELPREVVSINVGTLTGELHFEADFLSSTVNTDFYIYYGNAAASEPAASALYGSDNVWSNGYAGLWHLGEEQAGATGTADVYADSTGKPNGGDDYVSATGQGGQIPAGQEFDGLNDYVDAGTDTSLDMGSGDFTLSAWIQTTATDSPVIAGKGGDGTLGIRYLLRVGPLGELRVIIDDEPNKVELVSAVTGYNDGFWHHVVGVRDGTNLRLYVDGTADVNSPSDITGVGSLDSPRVFSIGSIIDEPTVLQSRFFGGLIDEVRVSNVVRPAGWIGTEHNNQLNPGTGVGGFLASIGPQEAQWFDPAWTYRKKITIDNTKVDADQTDFPVYVDLADLGADFHSNLADANGGDIRVTESDGLTELPRQVVVIDTGANTGELHFEANFLSSTVNTDFYIYYGNAAASEPAASALYGSDNVWANGYVGVWHLHNDFLDSSFPNNNGTNSGSTNTGGKIGDGSDFLASNTAGVDVLDSASLDLNSTVTVSVWFNPNVVPPATSYQRLVVKSTPTNAVPYTMYGLLFDNLGHLRAEVATGGSQSSIEGATPVLDGTWQYGTMTYDGTDLKLYYNGGAEATPTTFSASIDVNNEPLTMGKAGFDSQYFDGKLDEARVSSVARPAEWISTEYNNQDSPGVGGFLASIDSQEASSGGGATWAADEDTPLTGLDKLTTKRVRIEVSNEGTASSGSVLYRLEVSQANPTTCDDGGNTWTRVNSSTHWNMALSTHFADADATSDINPGLTNENTTFVAGELKESTDEVNTGIILSTTEFTEIEYAVQATASATDAATYCFRLTDAGTATDFTYTETKYAKVTLSGLSAAISSTNPASLTESNLNTATVTVTLTDGTYNGSLVTGDFSLNGAPTGTSISGVVRDSATQATLTLAFDLTDFDTDASMSVTVATTALVAGGPVTTSTVTAVVEVGAAITGTNPASLTESNLNTATVTVTLTDGTYNGSLVTGDFSLNGAPTGTSISGVVRDSATQATLTLAFDLTDFDSDANMSVTVETTALVAGGPATTGTVTVTAVVEASPDLQQLHYRWRNDDGGENDTVPPWWDTNYGFREEITITAGSTTIPSGYSVSFTEDTATLITNSKLRSDGNDWRVVYWNGASWVELDRWVDDIIDDGWNSANTTTWFKTQASITASSSDNNYYVYYGYAGQTLSPPASMSDSMGADVASKVFLYADDFEEHAASTDPDGWTDHGTEDFKVMLQGSEKWFQAQTRVVWNDGSTASGMANVGDAVWSAKFLHHQSSSAEWGGIGVHTDNGGVGYVVLVYDGNWYRANEIWGDVNGWNADADIHFPLGTEGRLELVTSGTNLDAYWYNPSGFSPEKVTLFTGFTIPAGTGKLDVYVERPATPGDRWTDGDDFIVREYVSPEPTTSNPTEETPAGASFATPSEDTPLTGLDKLTTKRVRIEISNEGASSSGSVLYRLEVSQANPATCDAGGNTWTRIDTSTHWNMVASTYFADADPTSDINPGLSNENTTFLAGELKEDGAGIDDETLGITLSTTEFTEIEYAIQATAGATDSATYCFRLTHAGTATDFTYTETKYAKVTLSNLSAAITSTNPASLTETNLNTATVEVTLTDGTYNGSLVPGDFSLNGAPTGTSISGVVRDTATQVTLTLAFDLTDFDSDANMSVTVETTALVTGGPITTGTVTVTAVVEAAPDLQQLHYRWRNDDGSEGGASGALVLGNPNTQVADQLSGTVGTTPTDLELVGFQVSTAGGGASLFQIVVNLTYTAIVDADVNNFRLYTDLGTIGTFDSGTDTLVATVAGNPATGTVTFGSLSETIGASATHYLVIYDVVNALSASDQITAGIGTADLTTTAPNKSGDLTNEPAHTATAAGSVTFTDIATASGLNANALQSMVFFDCNNDGYIDMAKTGTSDTALRTISVNDGDSTFTSSTTALTVGDRGLGAGDYDNDGDIDLVGQKPEVFTNNDTAGCTSWTGTLPGVNNSEATMFADIDGDGDLDIWDFGATNLWYRNDGGTIFTAQTTMPGPVGVATNGEGGTAADFTNDGYMDFIYAAALTDVEAFVNDGDNTYTFHTDVGASFGLPSSVADHENMEWAWGDCDDDGDLDVFISGATSEGLYENNGSGSFTNVTVARGLTIVDPDGADWGDYDNDGDLDLIAAQDGGVSHLYQNNGSCSFSEVASSVGLGGAGAIGNVVGWLDIDNDGDLDLMSGVGDLWRNDLDDTHYLKVLPVGSGAASKAPKTPIGAKIDVYVAGTATRVAHREVMSSYNNFQPPVMQHIGLPASSGGGSGAYDVTVTFPGGTSVTRSGVVPVNESITIGGNPVSNAIRIDESELLLANPTTQVVEQLGSASGTTPTDVELVGFQVSTPLTHTLDQIVVNLTYNGIVDADVNNFRLYKDLGTVGTFDSGTDTLVDTVAGNPTTGTVTFASLGESIGATATHYLVIYDVVNAFSDNDQISASIGTADLTTTMASSKAGDLTSEPVHTVVGAGTAATWAATEDTPLTGLEKLTIKRVRIEISNEGANPSGSVPYRLEVSQANPGTCDDGGNTWTRIDTSTHWNIVTSTYFADGDSTANIASGLTDGNTTFVAGELKESNDQTSGIILSTTEFTEIEYAIQATASAIDGATYCFRLTNAGSATDFTHVETRYAKVTLADMSAAITATNPASLTEGNLNAATVTVTLTDGTYNGSLVTGDFSLNGAPTGTTISGVVRDSATRAILTLAFDGTDFDSDASMSVTVATTALVTGGPLTTGTVTVTAVVEGGVSLQQLHYRWRNDDGGEVVVVGSVDPSSLSDLILRF